MKVNRSFNTIRNERLLEPKSRVRKSGHVACMAVVKVIEKHLFPSSEGIVSEFVSDLVKCLIQPFLLLLIGLFK